MSAHAKFGDQTSFARSAGASVITFSVESDDDITYASGDLVYIVTPSNRYFAIVEFFTMCHSLFTVASPYS